MRRVLFVLFLLAACQTTAPPDGPQPGVSPLATDAIAVTPLEDAPASPVETAPTVEAAPVTDEPRPTEPEAASAESQPDATPLPPSSPQQVLCEKSGGQWATAGTGASLCVTRTKDAGKRCNKKTDCQGQCLARSLSCSPIDPMIGCNDVLEKDGRMVTLCLN